MIEPKEHMFHSENQTDQRSEMTGIEEAKETSTNSVKVSEGIEIMMDTNEN